MKPNTLQFAITREDPELEIEVLKLGNPTHALLVCSGGDTIFALKKSFPNLNVTAFDFNPFQLDHFKKKSSADISTINNEAFPLGLCQTGNFESLFRQWRLFFNEFILNAQETKNLFESEVQELRDEMFKSPYWQVSFDMHFHDSFLRAMFGDAAVQHAPPGSYPRYFQGIFEKGLKQIGFGKNPFLQHIFFGEFINLPNYLLERPLVNDVELIQGSIFDIPALDQFDLIQLSNIFDWSDAQEVKSTCRHLDRNMKIGAKVLIRQINNASPVESYLGENFISHKELSESLLQKDKSLFYSKIILATKIK